MGALQTEAKLEALQERGVTIIDPRQTYVAPEVDVQRVSPNVVLYPGCRLVGERTFLGVGARVGTEGPAVLENAVLGPDTTIASGYLNSAVLLRGAKAGWGSHFRPGTLLEEETSTAHTVGLKHTILLSFVTLGSLINFCDCLMAGGTSRKDHSEVGSGFIHFNYTPWGKHGDKATPSLVGDVPQGVFLRQRRIFLGGSSGLVGPGRVGFGAVTGAGQVVRRPVAAGTLSVESTPAIKRPLEPQRLDPFVPRLHRNLEYVAQLVALKMWYRHVRLARVAPGDDGGRIVVEAALETLDLCIAERLKRVREFAGERGKNVPLIDVDVDIPSPLDLGDPTMDHVEWVQGLPEAEVERGVAWLAKVVHKVLA